MVYIKRFLTLIIAGAITLIGTIVLLILVSSTKGTAETKRSEVEANREKKENIKKFPWKLINENVNKSSENAKQATAYKQKVLDSLACGNCPDASGKPVFKTPEPLEAGMDAIRSSRHLMTESQKMWNRLTSGNLQVADGVKGFGLPDPTQMVPPEMIPVIFLQLQILDELTIIISESQLQQLKVLTPTIPEKDKKKTTYNDKEFYRYLEYTIEGVGTYEQIRKFVNSLSKSKTYFFLVRNMKLTPEERGIGHPADWQPQMGKDERAVYKQMSAVSFSITLDYIEIKNEARETKEN